MSEQLRSLRHERDVREHGAAVTTRPWWNAHGEESRAVQHYSWNDVEVSFAGIALGDSVTEVKLGPPAAAEFGNAYERILANPPARKPIRILANPRPFT